MVLWDGLISSASRGQLSKVLHLHWQLLPLARQSLDGLGLQLLGQVKHQHRVPVFFANYYTG